MRKILLAGAIALALAPLAIVGLAGAKPANPQGGTSSTACGGDTGSVNEDNVLTWTPTNLWPPNHKPRTISISYTDPNPTGLNQISVDIGMIAEFPANTDASGAGHTSPDYSGQNTAGASVPDSQTAHASVTLLSERSGHDIAGRTYAISVTCKDGPTSSMKTICVTVPHDQSANHAPVKDPAAECAADLAS